MKDFKRLSFIAILMPTLVFSNTGLPLLAIQWHILWLAFIPIVFIETWVMYKTLPIGSKHIFKASFWSNLTSTLFGIPMPWICALKMSPIIPSELLSTCFFVIPPQITKNETIAVHLSMLLWWVIFFGTSYWIEKWVTKIILRQQNLTSLDINRAVFRANLCSYGMLFLPTGFATLYFWLK